MDDRPEFDFSAMEPFWAVQTTLAADRQPTEAQWTALFETAGYRALTKSEFTRESFRRNFELSFMPSKVLERAAALSGADGAYVRHYVQVAQQREELTGHAARLVSATVMPVIVQRASAYLPSEAMKGYPRVAFVIFANDARAYDPIVVDLQASRNLDLDSFLAHEFHHWYRNHVLALDLDAVEPADQDLIWTLNQVQAEGIADLIDKRPWISKEAEVPSGMSAYADRYLANLSTTPQLLRSLDSLLARYPAAGGDRAAIGAEIRRLVPQSGHPTGFYMASLILEQFGVEELTRDAGNPFAFFLVFNRAAAKAGLAQVVFSPATADRLSELEHRYATDADTLAPS